MSTSGVPSDESPDADADTDTDGSVTIVGTAHASPDSLADIRETIADLDPDVVAVELCARRYTGRTPDDAPYAGDDVSPSVRTLLFLPLMQYLQERTAEQRGLDPDMTDMGVAIDSAIETDSQLALLDRDILTTFSRFWSNASIREHLRVVASIGLAIVRGDSTLLNTATPERETDTDVVQEYRDTTQDSFPTFRTVFLDERDEIMAMRLRSLQERGYDTVAVVGAAHKPGIRQALSGDGGTDDSAVSAPLLDPRPDLHAQ